METFSYDGTSANLQKAIDVHERGGKITCPICGSELLVILSSKERELMIKYQKNSGIYCLTNPKHMHKVFLMSDVMDEFRRRFRLDQ
jgi:predicted RNA-binding Zn-ribbon protein involved in translation (DUF1610 family)